DWATVTIDVPAKDLVEQYPSRDGRVLAVPESAVVYTGSQKLVYRQHAPTVFDAVVVELGSPLSGPNQAVFYPVLKGLEAGNRVVTVGSILLDAETKVSGAAGSIYFGGFGAGKGGEPSTPGVRPSTPEDEELKVKAALAELSTSDRKLAEAQKLCPILKPRLGARGGPGKVSLRGQPVFLCCKDCELKARADEAATLKTVEELKKTAGPARLSPEEAEIEHAMELLKPEERK